MGKNIMRDTAGLGFLLELAESLLPHDVPDRHVDLDRLAVDVRDREFLLRNLRPEGLDVLVVEVLEDEPADEARLPDGGLPDEADLDFHAAGVHRTPAMRDVASVVINVCASIPPMIMPGRSGVRGRVGAEGFEPSSAGLHQAGCDPAPLRIRAS